MAYRSDLEAALARLDAMGPRTPCLACAARARRHHRVEMFLLGVVVYGAAFLLVAVASITGLIGAVALLLGFVILVGRGDGNATCFVVGVAFALLSTIAAGAVCYLDRLLAFDVGRFG